MQQVIAKYSARATNVLDDTIKELGRSSDPRIKSSNLVNELSSLRRQVSDTLSLTLADEESLRNDVIKFECECSTKNEQLVKIQQKVEKMREERKERRDELEGELAELRDVFSKQKKVLEDEQINLEKSVEAELKSQVEGFEAEWNCLEQKRRELKGQLEDQSQSHAAEVSKLRDEVRSLSTKLDMISQDHEATVSALTETILSEQSQFNEETARRVHLEEHFQRVDRNDAIKAMENAKLNAVVELEKKAMALLYNGAVGLQKIWRGKRDRGLVTKMRSKKKKGKKGAGKKKKK